jgi:hypothetical protein
MQQLEPIKAFVNPENIKSNNSKRVKLFIVDGQQARCGRRKIGVGMNSNNDIIYDVMESMNINEL